MASPDKKSFALRIAPEVWAEVERLAAQELRSANAQADWLRDMLQGRGLGQGDGQGNGQGHGQGGHWQNEACPDCLAQLPCS